MPAQIKEQVRQKRNGILFPLELALTHQKLFGGQEIELVVRSGLTTLVGPNGSGKTQILRLVAGALGSVAGFELVRFLSAGRSAAFERFRSACDDPSRPQPDNAHVGHSNHISSRWRIESVVGDMLALDARPDLLIKVESRIHSLLGKRIRLQWTQHGLRVFFIDKDGPEYSAGHEASGVLQLVGLLAAIHDDDVAALLIDEPEVSLHPQFQSFLMQEILSVCGNPYTNPLKKLVIVSTHSPSLLELRRSSELPNMIFFRDRHTPPQQINTDSPELANRKLSSLIMRLGERHRLAFFAPTVLLVEGPSDEIIVAGLTSRLDIPLGGSGAQIVPVTGKGELADTAKFFKILGKRVVVVADLDALSDDNVLVNFFSVTEKGIDTATKCGHESLVDLDRSIRSRFAELVRNHGDEIDPPANDALEARGNNKGSDEQLRRREVMRKLLARICTEADRLPSHWKDLGQRLIALLDYLECAGCFFLRRGTIENYFLAVPRPTDFKKPELAVDEIEHLIAESPSDISQRYADVLRAISCAAAIGKPDENQYLRLELAEMVARAFQVLDLGLDSKELQLQAEKRGSSSSVFRLENCSEEQGERAVRVSIESSLFPRDNFPVVIRYRENTNDAVKRALPSADQ